MTYKEYIDIGFERTELDNPLEHDKNGYSGYVLNKRINENAEIEVYFNGLDFPKLYVEKTDGSNGIIFITPEQLKELCK